MAQLKSKISLYLEENSKTFEIEKENIVLQNDSDGNGDYIKSWNVSGLAEPTSEQIASYETAGNTQEAINNVLNNRIDAYPTWGEQMDMQYHDNVDGTTTWKDAIQAVKDAYPKP